MLKKRSLAIAGITALVLTGCSDSPVSSNESDLTTNENSYNSTSNQTAVEGIWLLTKEESEIDTLEFSYTDKSKYLTSYVLMLNNNGTGAIKTYGVQFEDGIYKEIDYYEQTQPISYTTNGSYLIVNNEALKFTNNGTELTLESSDSKRYFKAYTDLLPLENWEQENIFEYGFEPLNEENIQGKWIDEEQDYWGKELSIYPDSSLYHYGYYGEWSISSSGSLSIDAPFSSSYYTETFDVPYASKDGKLLALKSNYSNITATILVNVDDEMM